MSDFFDKLGAAARRAADNINTDLTIAAQEQKVKEAYQALGKLYYQHVSTGLVAEGDAFNQKMKAAEEALARIAQLKEHRDVVD